MKCFYCLLGMILLSANLFVMFFVDKNELIHQFFALLSDEQINKYKEIVNKRRKIYYQGLFLGLIIAYITAAVNKFDFLPCYILGITLTTNLIFYMLYPKGTYMIEHLNNQKQIQAYQLIYRNMQYQYYLGFFLGVIAVYLFGKSFCK